MNDRLIKVGQFPGVCPYCNNKIARNAPSWRVYQPTPTGPIEVPVCGRCFIQVDILRELKELREVINGGSKRLTDQVDNGHGHGRGTRVTPTGAIAEEDSSQEGEPNEEAKAENTSSNT